MGTCGGDNACSVNARDALRGRGRDPETSAFVVATRDALDRRGDGEGDACERAMSLVAAHRASTIIYTRGVVLDHARHLPCLNIRCLARGAARGAVVSLPRRVHLNVVVGRCSCRRHLATHCDRTVMER